MARGGYRASAGRKPSGYLHLARKLIVTALTEEDLLEIVRSQGVMAKTTERGSTQATRLLFEYLFGAVSPGSNSAPNPQRSAEEPLEIRTITARLVEGDGTGENGKRMLKRTGASGNGQAGLEKTETDGQGGRIIEAPRTEGKGQKPADRHGRQGKG